MQWMTAYNGVRVPVRDGFLIWPKRWNEAEEKAAVAAWAGPEPKVEDYPDVVSYARAYAAWVQLDSMLTARQRTYIRALTNRANINRSLAFISPLTFSDLGYQTACQVHGNRQKRPCGCEFHSVHDHHLAIADKLTDQDVKPLRALYVCDGHQKFNSLDAQYWTSAWDSGPVAAEWRYKGDVVTSADELHRLVRLHHPEAGQGTIKFQMEAAAAPPVA